MISFAQIPIDANSHPRTDIQRREWASAIRLLSQPAHPTIDQQYAADYDAIYLPGGHAPMFDLVEHRHLKQLLSDFDEQMKYVNRCYLSWCCRSAQCSTDTRDDAVDSRTNPHWIFSGGRDGHSHCRC